MARTDPQFNLRIPEALRDQVMAAAKENGRSSTAEILARLELSFLGSSSPDDDLMPADKARELSGIARLSIPATVKGRILKAVNQAVKYGHSSAEVHLSDLGLESIPTKDLDDLHESFSEMLSYAGYRFEWDGGESLWIDFEDRERAEHQDRTIERPALSVESKKHSA